MPQKKKIQEVDPFAVKKEEASPFARSAEVMADKKSGKQSKKD